MKSSNSKWNVLLFLSLSSCGNMGDSYRTASTAAGSQGPSTTSVPPQTTLTGDNVIPITVNGSTCSNNSYSNKPCVSVTVCEPGSQNCVTINDILLDTGSYGLRLHKVTLDSLNLTQVTSGSGSLAECVQYGDGSSQWGPVKMAEVKLGNEPSVQVPIEVIDSTFVGASNCGTPETSPAQSGFNGILGVGLFAQDCGANCATNANNQNYYACNGSTCTGTTVALQNQVQNPVSLLPTDNNGVIIELPPVPLGGADSVEGYMVLGIGTQSNNTPSNVQTYQADPSMAMFQTTFEGQQNDSFLDTGSNGLFFEAPTGSIPDCGNTDSNFAGWFCPSSPISLSATNQSTTGSVSGGVIFDIGNFISLISSNKNVFVDNGANGGGAYFDWGLPFFFGKNVYVGIEGKNSTLGNGPYWAY